MTCTGSSARGLSGPGVPAASAASVDIQTTKPAAVGHNDYTSACTGAAAAIVVRAISTSPVSRDSAGAAEGSGADHNNAAPGATAASRAGRIVARTATAASAKHRQVNGSAKSHAAIAADRKVGIPCVST